MTVRDVTLQALGVPAVVDLRTDQVLARDRFLDRCDRLSDLLATHGLTAGSVVALLADVSSDAYEALVAVRRAGLRLMPVDAAHTLEQVAFALNATGAEAILVSESHAELGESLVPLTPYVRARYCLDAEFPAHRSLVVARSAAAAVRVEALPPAGTLHSARGQGARPVPLAVADPIVDEVGREDLALLLGSTRVDPGTVLVPATGLSDPAAALIGAAVLEAGGGVVVPARQRGIDVMRAVSEADATVLHVSPTIACEIVELDERRLHRLTPPSLERVVVTAPDCPPQALARLVGLWGERVRQAYVVPGIGVVAATEGIALAEEPGCVGEPARGVRITAEPDRGAAGVIEFCGSDGQWISTGDLGYLEDGRLHLYAADIMVRTLHGTVLGRDVEDALCAHPAVAAAAIVDPGPAAPLRVHVELRQGHSSAAAIGPEIGRILDSRAAGVAWRLLFGILPRTAAGAVDRQRLRARRDFLDLTGPA